MRLYKSQQLRCTHMDIPLEHMDIPLEVDHAIARLLEQLQRETGAAMRLVGVTHTPLATSYGETTDLLVTIIAESSEPTGWLIGKLEYKGNIQRTPRTVLTINGKDQVVPCARLTYAALVNLAIDPAYGVTTREGWTITYRHGPPANPEGSVQPGQVVEVCDGMIFNVRETGHA